ILYLSMFFSLLPPPPRPTLFPYTTLFRSNLLLPSLDGHDVRVGLSDRVGSVNSPTAEAPDRRELRVAEQSLPNEVLFPLIERLRSEEHTSELQSRENLVCRLLLEKKKKKN